MGHPAFETREVGAGRESFERWFVTGVRRI